MPLSTVGEKMSEVCLPIGRSNAKDKVSGELVLALQFSYRQDKIDVSICEALARRIKPGKTERWGNPEWPI